MIVTKARDHSLVQLTRELAEWLMTSPRHGKSYGVRVYVDAKLEKSKRFDADGIYKDYEIVGEKNLLKYWTPESCVFADTFDIVITVRIYYALLTSAWWRWDCFVHVLALPADSATYPFFQLRITRLFDQL